MLVKEALWRNPVVKRVAPIVEEQSPFFNFRHERSAALKLLPQARAVHTGMYPVETALCSPVDVSQIALRNEGVKVQASVTEVGLMELHQLAAYGNPVDLRYDIFTRSDPSTS